MPPSNPTPVRFDSRGGWLFAQQLVSGSPSGTSFTFYLLNDATRRFAATTPPVRGGDDQVGRSYRVPGPLPVPMPLDEVLAMLNGCVLESSVRIRPGSEGGTQTATLVLLQQRGGEGGELSELGRASAAFTTRSGELEAHPSFLLECA